MSRIDNILAATSEQALGTLMERDNIKATPGDACRCAIAEYVKKDYPGGTVSVTESQIKVARAGEPETSFETSGPISEFVKSFDARFWPTLVR